MVILRSRRERAPVIALAAGITLVLVTGVIGAVLLRNGVRLHLLGNVVLRAHWDPRPGPSLALPVVVGALLLVGAGPARRRLSWSTLLPVAGLAAAAWAVSLALLDGTSGLTMPLTSRYEYLHDVSRVGSWGTLLDGFVASIPADAADPWTTHVAGHPPGALLTFAGLAQLGLGGAGWAAALCILAGASSVPAVLIATRVVAGEQVARAAAPFLVLAPIALWVATSADAFFLGVSAWGITALAVAASREDRSSDALAVVGGLLLGLTLFLSYGLVLLAPLALAVVLVRRRWQLLGFAAAGLLTVVACFALAGFWWVAGLLATTQRVHGGPGSMDRPAAYFLLANLAAAAMALGPAGVAALGPLVTRRVRRSAVAVLPLAALAGILVANFSLLSKGEVERIWLPFFPWILTATALLPARRHRAWLIAQVVAAIGIQVLVRTEW